MVILRSAHIAVRERQAGLRSLLSHPIQSVLEDGADAAVIGRVESQGTVTRRFESGVAVCLGHAQHAQTRAIALLGMVATTQHGFHGGVRLTADALCPIEQTLRTPARHVLMTHRHVFIHRGMSTFEGTAGMCRDSFTAMEGLHYSGPLRQDTNAVSLRG